MSDKYIIKNCDCILSSCRCNVKSLVYCQDCTDCLLKQIVEKCMEDWEDMATDRFQRELLDLLDIQEVE